MARGGGLHYAGLPASLDIWTQVDLQSLHIAAEGKSVQVRADVVEKMSLPGAGTVQMKLLQGVKVILGGEPKYSQLSARLAGKQ